MFFECKKGENMQEIHNLHIFSLLITFDIKLKGLRDYSQTLQIACSNVFIKCVYWVKRSDY